MTKIDKIVEKRFKGTGNLSKTEEKMLTELNLEYGSLWGKLAVGSIDLLTESLKTSDTRDKIHLIKAFIGGTFSMGYRAAEAKAKKEKYEN